MLLPFDIRADRVGWTVFEIATDRPASLNGMSLVGLSLEHAERAANALNALEIRTENAARRTVLDALGIGWQYRPADSICRVKDRYLRRAPEPTIEPPEGALPRVKRRRVWSD